LLAKVQGNVKIQKKEINKKVSSSFQEQSYSHMVSVVRELLQKQKMNDRLMGEDSSIQNFFEENVSSEMPSILKKCH